MKLATRYQRSHLLSTFIIFLLASTAFYVLVNRVLLLQMDEDLEIERREVETYVRRFGTLPQSVLAVEDQIVRYEKDAPRPLPVVYSTRTMWDAGEQVWGPFRQLDFSVRVGQDWYRASVSKSLEATRGLARQIGLLALLLIALLLLVSFLINRLVLRRLWRPFYQTIRGLRDFGLDDQKALRFPPVSTDEFALLNTTLTAVSDRALQEYRLLKEFTENAAHELQTPLAVMRTKLDLLLQDAALSQPQSVALQDAYTALARMVHLNQSLLQLAKIEGGYYLHRTVVDLRPVLAGKLHLLEDLQPDKQLQVTAHLEPGRLLMHPTLAEMLVSNLLTNAVRHNVDGGQVRVSLDARRLTVCNTAVRGALAPAQLFRRFSRSGDATTGTGLGLAISRQICDQSGCRIDYRYTPEGLHCFTVHWEEPNDG